MIYAKCTDLRRRLSEILDAVERGETVLLFRRGTPVARLVPPDDTLTAGASWQSPFRARPLRGESIVETIRRERDST